MDALLAPPHAGLAPDDGRRPTWVSGVRAAFARAGQRLAAGPVLGTTVRGAADLAALTGVEVIAGVPRFGPAIARPGARPVPDQDALAVYRAVRDLLRLRSGSPTPVVVLASARSGDGKTTTAANLALVTAQAGARVLLIDAETRRGDQHALFGVQSEPGFFDLMFAQAGDDDCIRRVSRDGSAFDLIPSGGATQANAADFIAAGLLSHLLARLRARYDAIFIDSPPLERFTDGACLGAQADAVLFVARAGRTPREAIRRAVRELRHVEAPLVGALLNDVTRR